jgi:hypothetical protein
MQSSSFSGVGIDLECTICCEEYCNSTTIDVSNNTTLQCRQLLPCAHSFCLACVWKLCEDNDGRPIRCPVCRQTFATGDIFNVDHYKYQGEGKM